MVDDAPLFGVERFEIRERAHVVFDLLDGIHA